LHDASGPNALIVSTQIARTMVFHTHAASPDLAEAVSCNAIHTKFAGYVGISRETVKNGSITLEERSTGNRNTAVGGLVFPCRS
jgi:hypothetical protein